jgi:hypothetical protein
MLTLGLEIQNYMYFSVDRSQWRYDESCNTPVRIQIAAAETNARGTVWFFCCSLLVDWYCLRLVHERGGTRFSALEVNVW